MNITTKYLSTALLFMLTTAICWTSAAQAVERQAGSRFSQVANRVIEQQKCSWASMDNAEVRLGKVKNLIINNYKKAKEQYPDLVQTPTDYVLLISHDLTFLKLNDETTGTLQAILQLILQGKIFPIGDDATPAERLNLILATKASVENIPSITQTSSTSLNDTPNEHTQTVDTLSAYFDASNAGIKSRAKEKLQDFNVTGDELHQVEKAFPAEKRTAENHMVIKSHRNTAVKTFQNATIDSGMSVEHVFQLPFSLPLLTDKTSIRTYASTLGIELN